MWRQLLYSCGFFTFKWLLSLDGYHVHFFAKFQVFTWHIRIRYSFNFSVLLNNLVGRVSVKHFEKGNSHISSADIGSSQTY